MTSSRKQASDYALTPLVIGQVDAASQCVGWHADEAFNDEMGCRLMDNIGDVLAPMTMPVSLEFDSPLETVFWVWWQAVRKFDWFCRENLAIEPHVSVVVGEDRYVLDFVVRAFPQDGHKAVQEAWPLIGIELDGHAFHEKTLEQVTYRNKRDRALQQAGWKLFHFSFSEFMKEPEDAILEVVDYARNIYAALLHPTKE